MSGEMTQNGQEYAATKVAGSVTERSILNGVSAADVGVIAVMDGSPIFVDGEPLRHTYSRLTGRRSCGAGPSSLPPDPAPRGVPMIETHCGVCVARYAASRGLNPHQLINDGNRGFYIGGGA